jgi:hypothetical protein
LGFLGALGAMAFTAVSMVTMWVFAAAGLANTSDPEEVRRVGMWVLGFSVLCAAGVGVGVWLLWRGNVVHSALASLAPSAVMFMTLVYLLVR